MHYILIRIIIIMAIIGQKHTQKKKQWKKKGGKEKKKKGKRKKKSTPYLIGINPESIQVEVAIAERKTLDSVPDDIQNFEFRQVTELIWQLTDIIVT